MTSLVSTAGVRILVNTSLTDASLQAVIDRIEAEITAKIGEPQNDNGTMEVSETLEGECENLFTRVEIASVVGIVEDDLTLDASEYRVWSGGVIERLPEGAYWGDRIVVTYKPVDDRPQRTQAIIDLVRLVLEQTAMKGENIAGEYSFQAPTNWEAEKRNVIRRLMFTAV
jgi:hypothetical protein